MRLYLDVCALNRPYDDQTIDRNRLEAEAVAIIIGRIGAGRHSLVSSEAIDRENAACPDLEKVELVRETLRIASHHVVLAAEDVQRFEELLDLGFRSMDALHLACAEAGNCNFFISTDDKLIKRAGAHRAALAIRVVSPLTFVTEVEK
jgi:predicted nucleic acid-binding protein